MAVCIVPNDNKDTYDSIKRVCLIEKGVSSQVVTSKLLGDERKKFSAVTKIAIQMSAKLGGEPWGLQLQVMHFHVYFISSRIYIITFSR